VPAFPDKIHMGSPRRYSRALHYSIKARGKTRILQNSRREIKKRARLPGCRGNRRKFFGNFMRFFLTEKPFGAILQ
jgi:hypothetical protein